MKIDECIDYVNDINKTVIFTSEQKVDEDFFNSVAEWLKELKELRKLRETYKKGMETSYATFKYNQAIDDFVKKIELKYYGVHPDELYKKYYPREIVETTNKIAEQLKGA